MSSKRRRPSTPPLSSWPLLCLLGAVMVLGCFKPSILDNTFACGPNGSCPSGFSCLLDRCRQNGVDAGSVIDIKPEMPEVPVDVVDGPPEMAPVCPKPPLAGCTARDGLACDPVCQSGCCSNQKCSALNTDGEFGCVALVGVKIWHLNEPCDPSNRGLPDRTDNCSPGLICVEGNTARTCLKLCRDDSDCGDTTCEKRPLELKPGSPEVHVCGLEPTVCNPTVQTNSGCGTGRTCYLLASDKVNGDTTVCEISSGGTSPNESCLTSRDCAPKLTCAGSVCRPVCAVAPAADICPAGNTCQSSGKSFDFCF